MLYVLELVEEWLLVMDDGCCWPSAEYGTGLLSPRLAFASTHELLGRDCIADGSARKYIGIESGTESRPDRPVFAIGGGETPLLVLASFVEAAASSARDAMSSNTHREGSSLVRREPADGVSNRIILSIGSFWGRSATELVASPFASWSRSGFFTSASSVWPDRGTAAPDKLRVSP